MRAFFLLFITVPIIEMWLLIEVGSVIGALSTILLVFLTAAIGLILLRQQGLSTLLRVNQRIEQGQLPASEIIEGVLLAVGGALLLTPGFLTDAIGFACLLPPSRKLMAAGIVKQGLLVSVASARSGFGASFQAGPAPHSRRGPRDINDPELRREQQADPYQQTRVDPPSDQATIDGEYRRDD